MLAQSLPRDMLDTFTLLILAILQSEAIGFGLLLAWYVSRRARTLLGTCGVCMIAGALCLLPLWYLWDRGGLVLPWLDALLIALLLLAPITLVLVLVYALVRSETLLRAARLVRLGAAPAALSEVAEADDLADDLRAAMQDPGQLFVVYQPIYSASDRTLVGFEALLRWNHPQRGLISPMTFIPVAEQTHLIVPLGAWVLETACLEAASWPRSLYVSVNLSPVQLERSGLAREVIQILEGAQLPAERLELEVTEGVMVAAEGGEIARLSELRRAGVRVAIDDFGTGYSSLSYLRQMPFDVLKIDRAFVRDLESDPGARAIVATIANLAQPLTCRLVAEGVETEEQFVILEALGIHRVQGWLLGKPMSTAEIWSTYWPPHERAIPAGWDEKRLA